MSELSLFLKKNKIVKDHTFYTATKSLVDENGEPLKWEIRQLSTKENEAIRDECTYEVPITGKVNAYRQKINTSKFIAKMLSACVVFPDLYNSELQDSYGVKTPEDLVREMIDDYGEYTDFVTFVQNYNGLGNSIDEKVEEAKN